MNGIQELYRLRLAEGVIEAGDTTPMMVFPIGEWHSKLYPDLPLTEDLANELIANFEAGVLGTEPVVDSSGKHDTSTPAAGWVKRVYLASYEEGAVTGLALWADVKWTALGATMLSDDQYKYGSVEIGPVTMNDGGAEVDNVLRSLTLTNTPVLRLMPGVKNAAEKQRAVVTLSLSEVTLADPAADPVAAILDDMDALAAKADAAMKGKKGMPSFRTMMREARAKLSAHALSEDPGDPAANHPANSDGSSHPAKATEGQPVTLAEGHAATKGVETMNPKTLKTLKLAEGADEAAVETAVIALSEDRDAEKTRADAAELKLAETEQATHDEDVKVRLDKAVELAEITPGERITLAEKDDVHRDAFLDARKGVKAIKLGEKGSSEKGSSDQAKRADVELAEKTKTRMTKDSVTYSVAMGLVLSEDLDLKTRYEDFQNGKEA